MDELYRIEEDGDEVFVCVEVLRTQNLTRELMVRISTSDGTAVGMSIFNFPLHFLKLNHWWSHIHQ